MKTSSKTLQIVLPHNFQEILIGNEMRFDRGERSVHLIRNLLYLYSIGTEYYDTINNHVLHGYYKSKLNSLISDPAVVSELEKHPGIPDTIELFEDNNLYKYVPRKRENSDQKWDRVSENSDMHCVLRTSHSMCNSVDSGESNDLRKSKLKSVSTKFFNRISIVEGELNTEDSQLVLNKHNSDVQSFERSFKECIKKQNDKFERRKQQKQLKQYLIRSKKTKSFMKRSKAVLIASSNVKADETKNILDTIFELSQRKILIDQTRLQREIENFISNNMLEMHQAISELKENLEKEAKFMEENGFPQVAERLYEEIDLELEQLKEQYEINRNLEIERMKSKFIQSLKC